MNSAKLSTCLIIILNSSNLYASDNILDPEDIYCAGIKINNSHSLDGKSAPEDTTSANIKYSSSVQFAVDEQKFGRKTTPREDNKDEGDEPIYELSSSKSRFTNMYQRMKPLREFTIRQFALECDKIGSYYSHDLEIRCQIDMLKSDLLLAIQKKAKRLEPKFNEAGKDYFPEDAKELRDFIFNNEYLLAPTRNKSREGIENHPLYIYARAAYGVASYSPSTTFSLESQRGKRQKAIKQ